MVWPPTSMGMVWIRPTAGSAFIRADKALIVAAPMTLSASRTTIWS